MLEGVGGPIIKVVLDGNPFSVPEDAEVNRKLGGDNNEIQMNGNGTGRLIKSKTAWELGGLTVSCDDDLGDQELIQTLADRKSGFPVEIELASGAVYQGFGQITGELAFSSKNTTMPVALGGAGKLTKQ